jgi:hypothetical protein
MDDTKIKDMLAEIVEEIDYDVYKEIFWNLDSETCIQTLIDIVNKYLKENENDSHICCETDSCCESTG